MFCIYFYQLKIKIIFSLKKIYLYGCYNIKHIQEIKESIGENGGKNFEINI